MKIYTYIYTQEEPTKKKQEIPHHHIEERYTKILDALHFAPHLTTNRGVMVFVRAAWHKKRSAYPILALILFFCFFFGFPFFRVSL